MTRCLSKGDVFYWEEPVYEERGTPELRRTATESGVQVLTPLLPHGLGLARGNDAERALLDLFLAEEKLEQYLTWYYTPMALRFSSHLTPETTLYDCMDELSAFQGAPPELMAMEQRLFAKADVVFAGGASLFTSKKTQHANVHLFPSSIDREHFAAARHPHADPADQASIPHPRIGFYGVLDERLDRCLLLETAEQHPEWQFVLIGPVVKIDEKDLPRASNIHYLGQKSYADLPKYLANWDVAMLPFAQNQSTRFISPTKTPEYLAGGKPVVSTPIRDVVKPYGDLGLVYIGATAEKFGSAIAAALQNHGDTWLANVDKFLAGTSWDRTFEGMWHEIENCKSRAASETAQPVTGRSVHV